MDNCGSSLSSVYLLRSVLLLLTIKWPLIVGGDTLELNRRGIISNVNFGAFMTPINRIINSGSTWTHTYQIEGLTEYPIPPELRKNTTLTYEACLGIARSIIYMTFDEDSVKNYTKDQAIKFETDQCSKSVKMSKVFNNQKSLIIGSIDCNIQNIQDFLKGKVEVRHFKCAPFSLIGRIGEKLFGLGRKISIDLAHRNHTELICQVNNSFGIIAGQFSKLWSVTRIQNDALRKTIGRIDNQEKQIQNLTESMRKSQKAIDILQQYQASHISMLYTLQTYQTALQKRLLKITMTILNTLQLINTQTGKIVNGLQQLTRGELSADLIPPRKL